MNFYDFGTFACLDGNLLFRCTVLRHMRGLKEFKVRLIGEVVQTVSILAETHTIAIYRAATVAIMVGAKDFAITAPTVGSRV